MISFELAALAKKHGFNKECLLGLYTTELGQEVLLTYPEQGATLMYYVPSETVFYNWIIEEGTTKMWLELLKNHKTFLKGFCEYILVYFKDKGLHINIFPVSAKEYDNKTKFKLLWGRNSFIIHKDNYVQNLTTSSREHSDLDALVSAVEFGLPHLVELNAHYNL